MIKIRPPKRPPKAWSAAIMRRIKKQYPKFSSKQIAKIIAGIWNKYTLAQKIMILQRLARGTGYIPSLYNPAWIIPVLAATKSSRISARLKKALVKKLKTVKAI